MDYNKGYTEQKEETRPFIDYYVSRRLPKWLNRFDTVLKENNNIKDAVTSGGKHKVTKELVLVGHSLSYVDLALFLVLDGNRSEVGSADGVCAASFNQHASPVIKCFMRQMEKIPQIKARMAVRPPFSQTGPLF